MSILHTQINLTNLPLSTGWKLVSFLLSNPAANSISGTEQLPKSPTSPVPTFEMGVALATGATSVADAEAVASAVTVTVLCDEDEHGSLLRNEREVDNYYARIR